MKSMIVLFFLILIQNIKTDEVSKYNIKNFLIYLEANGYFEPIQSMKAISDDVAIEFCQALCNNKNCGTVVKLYMIYEGSRGLFKRNIDYSQIFNNIIQKYMPLFLKRLNLTKFLLTIILIKKKYNI